MTISEMEQELKILKAQASAIERILPTLATKQDLHDEVAKLATKDDLKAFATKDDLKAFATKDDLKAFATKDDLRLTTEALQHEIQTAMAEAKHHAVILNEATRDEIRALAEGTALVSERMATKSDVQELRRELRGEMAALGVNLRGDMAALESSLRGDMQGLSTQIAALGASRRGKRR